MFGSPTTELTRRQQDMKSTISRKTLGHAQFHLNNLLELLEQSQDIIEAKLPEKKYNLDRLYDIVLRHNKDIPISEEDYRFIRTEILKVINEPYKNTFAKWFYRTTLFLAMLGFAVTAIPGINNIVSESLIGASQGVSEAVMLSAKIGGGFIQFAAVYDTYAIAGPRPFGGTNLTVTTIEQEHKKNHALVRIGDTFKEQPLGRRPLEFIAGAMTALANSLIVLSQGISSKTVSAALLSFPGSLLIFFLATRYFTTTAGPKILMTFSQINNFFESLKKEQYPELFNTAIDITGKVTLGIYSILVTAITLVSQLITMGFVGAFSEMILSLIAASMDSDPRESIPIILSSYGIGLGTALALTLLFMTGILTIALNTLSSIPSIFRRSSTEDIRQGCLKLTAKKLFKAISIMGILCASLYAGLTSPGSAIPAIETFLSYFAIILSEESKLKLQLLLTGGSTLTNGRFGINVYNMLLEAFNKTLPLPKNLFKCNSSEELPIRSISAEISAPIITGTLPIHGAAFGSGITAIVGIGLSIAKTVNEYDPNSSNKMIDILNTVLIDFSTIIPTFAVYGFIVSFLVSFIGYVLIGLYYKIKPGH